MNKVITLFTTISFSLSLLIISSCSKTEPDEVRESFEYNFEQLEGRGIVTTLKQLGFDDQGIPGNPEPRPFCFNTGGNCVCAVNMDSKVQANLSDLDHAIHHELQQEFFNIHHYGDIFDLSENNIVEKVQRKLEQGKLFFKKVHVAGTGWYFASKPQHLHREGQDFIDRAVLSIQTADEYFSHDGH